VNAPDAGHDAGAEPDGSTPPDAGPVVDAGSNAADAASDARPAGPVGAGPDTSDSSGCGCVVAGYDDAHSSASAVGALALVAALGLRRRRARRDR
jgi:MYXO-CTERM domain-containing protein